GRRGYRGTRSRCMPFVSPRPWNRPKPGTTSSGASGRLDAELVPARGRDSAPDVLPQGRLQPRGRSALGRPRERTRTRLSRPTRASAGERDRCAREESDPAEPQTRAAGCRRLVAKLELVAAGGNAGGDLSARPALERACRARRSSTTREERRPAPRTGRRDPRSARETDREAAAARAPRAAH